MANFDVVIVNWNAGEQLRRCLDSLAKAGRDGFGLERVVVVDNASADGSADGLEYPSLPIVTIRNNCNEGFAAACNKGASASGADYLLFLNPDTELFEDSISVPLAFMARGENGGIGIAGIALVDERGRVSRSCARFPSLARCVSRALGLFRLSSRIFPAYVMSEWDHGASRAVDHVSGAFFLVRRAVFEKLAGFDERFFVYLEDVDFSYRASLAGWGSYYVAEARAFHKGGGLSEGVKAERLFLSTSSRILYAFKHFNRVESASLMLVTVAIEPLVRLCSAVVTCSADNVAATVRGYALLYRALPRLARGMRV
ncbi:MAG: glycosyltransferase family 2 protein, partial [Candidatus Krumholzibacteria bacterium]|nr:glycosyltransferase family 2 protein [Candidatus Krumholzibacteria bacterium]